MRPQSASGQSVAWGCFVFCGVPFPPVWCSHWRLPQKHGEQQEQRREETSWRRDCRLNFTCGSVEAPAKSNQDHLGAKIAPVSRKYLSRKTVNSPIQSRTTPTMMQAKVELRACPFPSWPTGEASDPRISHPCETTC
jgi:hypothetical protein